MLGRMQLSTTVLSTLTLVALVVALIAAVGCIFLAIKLQRIRRAQVKVLGQSGERDLVAHSKALHSEVEALDELVRDSHQRLCAHVTQLDTAVTQALNGWALVRYDAYGEQSGQQSYSLALLNSKRSGIVISTIVHRDHARLYAKQIDAGQEDVPLSPEEAEAVQLAAVDRQAAAVVA